MRVSFTITLALALGLAGPRFALAEDDHGHDHGDQDDHGEATEEAAPDDHDEHDEGLVRLSPAELTEFGVELATAGPGRLERTLELPGEVQPNNDRLAHIVPRYSGIVTEVRAKIGDEVKKGQVLAVVESDESLSAFQVKTLISGTVIGKHITLGEAASRERDAFVIADLSSVWIDLTVYQRDLSSIRVGQSVDVYVGHDIALSTGTISYVTPIIDEHTRTATARLELANDSYQWRPGMFVTARVEVESREASLAVPLTAIQTIDGEPVVFVETAEGFAPRHVTLGSRGATLVEILSGLAADERYVSDGGFTLKSELEKDSFGDGHNH